jgi:hypothetical protein
VERLRKGEFEMSIFFSSDMFRRTAVMLTFIVLVGCVQTQFIYDDQDFAPGEFATIVPYSCVLGAFSCGVNGLPVRVQGIDTVGTRSSPPNLAQGDVEGGIRMLPGPHTLRWSWGKFSWNEEERRSWRGTISFMAEAGHAYRIDGEFVGEGVRVWITDKTTGQEVADGTEHVLEGLEPIFVDVFRAYDGPAHSREKVAVLNGSLVTFDPTIGLNKPQFHSTNLVSIDGRFDVPQFWADTIKVEVLPGAHLLSVRSLIQTDIPLVVEQGEEYRVRAHSDFKNKNNKFHIWVENIGNSHVETEVTCEVQRNNWSGAISVTNCIQK